MNSRDVFCLSLPVREEFESGVLVRHGIDVNGKLHDISELTLKQQTDFDVSYVSLLSSMWDGFIKALDGRPDFGCADYAMLERSTCRYLWHNCHKDKHVAFLAASYIYSEELKDTHSLNLRPGDEDYLLSIPVIHQILSFDFIELSRSACHDGCINLISPFSGNICTSDISFIPTESIYWYRFLDEDEGQPFYVVGSLHHCRVVCIYIPQTQTMIMRSSIIRHLLEDQFHGEIDHVLLRHIAIYCKNIVEYINAPKRDIALLYGEEHLNHHLWNELSGIDAFLREPAPPAPTVFEMSSKSEMYGDLDQLFPQLKGKIARRYEDRAELIAFFYAQNVYVMRVTSMFVTARLRERLKSIANTSVGRIVEDLPTVAFVLRTENRTLGDSVAFFVECAKYIMLKIGKVRFIIDGRVRSPRDTEVKSEGEGGSLVSLINTEKKIAAALADELRFFGADVIVNVDSLIYENLFWLYKAKFFIGAWGTGLTRVRWLANLPGLMLSNSSNLQKHHDFHLYDNPLLMEDPSPLYFPSPAAIVDRPDLETLVPSRANFGENFDVIFSEIQHQIDDLIVQCFTH